MPSVTAKSMAEMMTLPGYAQMNILAAQKYPKQAPNVFRVPYYSAAIAAFRAAYRSGSAKDITDRALAKAQTMKIPHQRDNLSRVVKAFQSSTQGERKLREIAVPRLDAHIETVSIRASADLEGTDDSGHRKVIYFHCGAISFDTEAAKRLLEISHWIYEQNGRDIDPIDFEMIDLSSGTLHRVKVIRPTTIKNMKATSKMIAQLWDGL